MYTTREALAYTGKLPMQQNQAAITPQLLDLLALQKVEADKKAAAQQLAMASGQPQPTVAQGLQQRAMQSARQEVAQKMGLAGLAQAQPPAGPMPQPPQGLAGAPTNLPAEYQGGGIIAFAQGGSGGDAHGRFRQRDEEEEEEVVSEERAPEMPAENAEFIRNVQAAALKGLNQDPEALGKEEMRIQQEMLSPSRDASIARKREQQAGLKALYERQIAERPSGLRVALDRIAQNINQPGGFGAAMQGVSQAGQAAREGYTKQEIAQLTALSAIDDEIAKAIENNDVSKYNAGVARRKEVRGEMKDALQSGTSLSNVLESAQSRKEADFSRIQANKQNAALERQRKVEAAAKLAQERADALATRSQEFRLRMAELGGRRDADANLRRDQLKQKAATDAIALAEKADKYGLMEPEAQDALIKKYYNQIVSMAGDAPAAPGGGNIASLAAQELARRQGQRRTITGGR